MPFTNDEWDAISQELPKPDDAFVQKYLQGRQALIEQENSQRSDASFRKNLSPIARKACEIVARIRDSEQRTIWTPQLEDKLAQQAENENITVHPGMMFSLSKERMESTRLWKIVRRMPKGSLLHAHMDAMVDFHFLLDLLLKTPGMHIISPVPLSSPEIRQDSTMEFRFRKQKFTHDNVWSEDYKPGTPVLLTQAADAFPDGGRDGFVKWMYSRCIISKQDAVEQHHGIDHIWLKFSMCFRVVASIIHYEPIYRAYLRRLMSQLKADGVNWCEIRFGWGLDYCSEGSETPETDYVAMMDIFDQELKDFQNSPEGKGFWGMRIIWVSLRFKDARGICQDMDNCITAKITHPHLISGYDMAGQEDAGRPLKNLLPELFWFRKQCAEDQVNIPFFFHAGECLGSGSETDHNLYDAILLGTRRIGHGFSLYKHPMLIDLVKEKKILIESCPISNEVLRLCGSIMSHPLPALLARGVACCLCNDDPAMLGQDTAGSTHDFWQALQGWENLGLAGLGSLAENSVRWSAFEDQTNEEWTRDVKEASTGSGLKAKRLQEWSIEWEQFCLWIVTEFGEEQD